MVLHPRPNSGTGGVSHPSVWYASALCPSKPFTGREHCAETDTKCGKEGERVRMEGSYMNKGQLE